MKAKVYETNGDYITLNFGNCQTLDQVAEEVEAWGKGAEGQKVYQVEDIATGEIITITEEEEIKKYAKLFEEVIGTKMTEQAVTEALVGITPNQVKKLMKPLNDFKYKAGLKEIGYEERTAAENNYDLIQPALFYMVGELENNTWGNTL